MAKVVPAHEVGLPEGAGRVRVSSSRTRRGRILAVEHPVFGWIKYREWAFLGYVERLVERIGPLELVAWTGFTLAYKGGIDSAQAFADWLSGRGTPPDPGKPGKTTGPGGLIEQSAGALADFAYWWASGISQVAFAFVPESGAFPELPVGEVFGEAVAETLGGFVGALGKTFFPFGEISEWFWAAIAGAISVLALKRV